MWKQGTIIVCVDDTQVKEYIQYGMHNGIRKGEMYTVRSYAESCKFKQAWGETISIPAVWLNEVTRKIVNPSTFNFYNKDPYDMPYAASRFRLLETSYNEVVLSVSETI
jgi:hypothetical protein